MQVSTAGMCLVYCAAVAAGPHPCAHLTGVGACCEKLPEASAVSMFYQFYIPYFYTSSLKGIAMHKADDICAR